MRSDFDVLGNQFAIYPGHPVTLAYVITQVFASLDEATEMVIGANGQAIAPAAVASSGRDGISVPGAGGSVYAALTLLKRIKQGECIEEVLAHGDRQWQQLCTEAFSANLLPGIEQAERVKPLLRECIQLWFQQSSVSEVV